MDGRKVAHFRVRKPVKFSAMYYYTSPNQIFTCNYIFILNSRYIITQLPNFKLCYLLLIRFLKLGILSIFLLTLGQLWQVTHQCGFKMKQFTTF